MATPSEVFRFVTIRPPQHQDDASSSAPTILLARRGSELVEALRNLRNSGSTREMVARAKAFVASDEFVGSRRSIDLGYADFADAAGRLRGATFWDDAAEALKRTFPTPPTDQELRRAFERTADSIIAAAVDESVPPGTVTFLVRLARALWLVSRLAGHSPVSRAEWLAARLVLPEGIFPVPGAPADLKESRRAAAEARTAAAAARKRRLDELSSRLAGHRRAVDELLTTLERNGVEPAAGRASARAGGFVLPAAAANALTEETKRALDGVAVRGARIDVAKAIHLLDRRASEIAGELHVEAGPVRSMVRVGDHFVPSDAFGGGVLSIDPGDGNIARSPGPCPPQPDTGPVSDEVTVPTGHGDAKVLGIADLMVLEQQLLRYQLGEIAHIENVLRTEKRSRRFRTASTTERSDLTETETTETKEQDLSSTERFELQTESETVINQSASMDAGLTITASYGPSVDVTANFNVATSTSREDSNRASATYAREVTTKAVSQVQSRALKRRFVRTVDEVEEINEHGFDNSAGTTTDVVGIYRFVDKIYQAQVVNYGKRLMLEFLVPEPAAFLRYAMTRHPTDEGGPMKPEPPGYCLADGKSFAPLQATDITRDNYPYWAGKYGAVDVTPAPPQFVIASGAKKSPEKMPTTPSGGARKINSDTLDVAIADGYLCQSAFVNLYGETQTGLHKLVFQIQDQQREYIEPGDDAGRFALYLQPTPTLTVTLNAIGFHNYEMLVTVFCTLSDEKYQAWQLKTFASIMDAYNELRSKYDQAIEAARIQETDPALRGSNPTANRERERTELKKGCISLFTGQRFDLFDSVARNVAPYGYPEIDFEEAKAEGEYIQAFEQSFEWNNMTYLFYPYFWGAKSEWPALAQLSDGDPLFASFLQAGAARVQVPVRPGFEERILTFARTGLLWPAEGSVANTEDGQPDPLHFSVLDELKSQTGNNNVEGVGTLSVTQGDTAVVGEDTEFSKDDERRRISIGGVVYVIKRFTDATHITLSAPYAGGTDSGLGYSLGGKLVGEPWEVKLPTSLVKLDGSIAIA